MAPPPKAAGNLAMVAASAIHLDIEKFLHPDTKLEETTRVLAHLRRLSQQFPFIDMNGKASDASYALVLNNDQRRGKPSFPNMNTASGREQHQHDNEQVFLLLQAIFGEAWTIITEDDFLDLSSYSSVDCPYHIRDDAGHILERFPIAAVAINKLLDHCKEDANVVNEILRAKITAYSAPASYSNADIMRHNKQLQELQNLWKANSLHPDVQATELTRIHQLVMTLRMVTKSDNPLKCPYESFLSIHRNETSFTKFIENLKSFVQGDIRNEQSFASATSKKPTDPRKRKTDELQVTANATLPGTQGTCPMHPNAKHTAEQCNGLRRLAKEIHDSGSSNGKETTNKKPRSYNDRDHRPKTFHQPKASDSQKLHDPTGKYQGKNFDVNKWQAHHAQPSSDQDQQLAQALQAAMGPRVHFDSEVNALCVVPRVETPPIILESASDAEDVETMQEKSDNGVGDDEAMDEDKPVKVDNDFDPFDDDEFAYKSSDDVAQNFVYLADHYDLPEVLLDRIEAFHNYISNFAANKGDTTSEAYQLNRQLHLAGINAYMQDWLPQAKTRSPFSDSEDEDDEGEDEPPDNSDVPVDTDPDSPRAQPKV